MNDNKIIENARCAAEELQREIDEAEFWYESVSKIHKIISALLKLLRFFRNISFILICFDLLRKTGELANLLVKISPDSTIFLKTLVIIEEKLFSIIQPFESPLLFGLTLYIVALIFSYLFRLVDQIIISPEEVKHKFNKEIDNARSLLDSLEKELSNIYTEEGI
jgi:hypothetical protein